LESIYIFKFIGMHTNILSSTVSLSSSFIIMQLLSVKFAKT